MPTRRPTPFSLCELFSFPGCVGIILRLNLSVGSFYVTCRVQSPSILRARRDGACDEATDRGRSGLDADRTVSLEKKPPSYPPRHRKYCMNVSPEARTNEILCKPNVGTKSAVDERLTSGLTAKREALFVLSCWPVDRRLFVFVNPFHARHVREKCPYMPCMRRVYRDKASVHWSAARKKSASRPGDKPRMNRLSTADFVPAFGLPRVSLVRTSGETFGRLVFDALEGPRDACPLGDQFCWHHPVLPDPAWPPRRAPPRPARGMFGFWT